MVSLLSSWNDDGLSFNTGDIRGADGNNGLNGSDGEDGADGLDGKGWTGGFYSAGTGTVTFQSNDGLGFSTGDLRGPNGTGWTGGSYNAANGVVTFTSDDGLGFVTGDLRGADGSNGTNGIDGLGWTGGSYDSGTGVVTFTSDDGLGFTTGDLRGAPGMSVNLQQCTDNGNTTTNKIQAAGFRIDQLTTITSTSPDMAYDNLQPTDTMAVQRGDNTYQVTVDAVSTDDDALLDTDWFLVNRGENSYKVSKATLKDEIGGSGDGDSGTLLNPVMAPATGDIDGTWSLSWTPLLIVFLLVKLRCLSMRSLRSALTRLLKLPVS